MSEGKYLIYEIAILNECVNFITGKVTNGRKFNLVDEGSSVCGHLKNDLLRNLPDGLVQSLQVVGKVQILLTKHLKVLKTH